MSQPLDSPEANDNRNYNYEKYASTDRIEYPIIVDMVESNSKVIDLGCGNGSLLKKLISEKNIVGYGIEISKSGVEICKTKGLNVVEGKIDEQIPFPDNYFDYAICNVTVQMVMYPEMLLSEMRRISHFQIISFPNFAFWLNRFDLLVHGRMPKPMLFGYSWFSTGHIHQLSIEDFKITAKKLGLEIIKSKSIHKTGNPFIRFLIERFPNLFSVENVFLLKKINE